MDEKDGTNVTIGEKQRCGGMSLCQSIIELLDIKTFLSLAGMIVFVVLSLNGTLDVESILIIITMIFQSYFTYKVNKQDVQK